MNRRSRIIAVFILLSASTGWNQERPATEPATAEVRKTLEQAQGEIAAFRNAGGKAGADDHPARKWSAALWDYRQRNPGTDAAGLAAAEAIHLLVHAERFAEVESLAESLEASDPGWERLPNFLLEAANLRKDYGYLLRKLDWLAQNSMSPKAQAAALFARGRALRQQGDAAGAAAAFEKLRRDYPAAPQAQEAANLLYEMSNLGLGKAAPEVAARTRAGKAVTLAGFRGQAVALIFWSST